MPLVSVTRGVDCGAHSAPVTEVGCWQRILRSRCCFNLPLLLDLGPTDMCGAHVDLPAGIDSPL